LTVDTAHILRALTFLRAPILLVVTTSKTSSSFAVLENIDFPRILVIGVHGVGVNHLFLGGDGGEEAIVERLALVTAQEVDAQGLACKHRGQDLVIDECGELLQERGMVHEQRYDRLILAVPKRWRLYAVSRGIDAGTSGI